ncbi:MAG: hypothetical protein AAGF89_02715 [Bacteroidota bacterium]
MANLILGTVVQQKVGGRDNSPGFLPKFSGKPGDIPGLSGHHGYGLLFFGMQYP